MVCSLISKSPDFIFIGIDYGGILNEWAPIICYFIIKYLTSHLRTLQNIYYLGMDCWLCENVKTE
jgi:hypothetical protein